MTYPPDIMQAAEAALDKLLCNCAESCGGFAGVRDASINDIAAAIAAEREACAKIADEHSAWTRSYGAEEACEMVAKAIRARGDQ